MTEDMKDKDVGDDEKDDVFFDIILKDDGEVVEVPYAYVLPPTPSESFKLDTKAELGLRLFASGMKVSEAAKLLKINPGRIHKLLNSSEGRDTLGRIRGELDEEFKALYALSIQSLREGLDNADIKVRMDAADKVLKYQKELKISVSLTAEDVVKMIREGKEV